MKKRMIIIGNEEKRIVVGHSTDKRSSKNPIKNMLLKNFDRTLLALLADLGPKRILEIGCGEGYVVEMVKKTLPTCHYVGVDLDKEVLAQTEEKGADEVYLSQGEPIQLPYHDNSFDLVLMIEVLEHLYMPKDGLREAKRLTTSHFIASVPNEPLWRIINVIQLRHLRDLGNTPGHINHWGEKEFHVLISSQFIVEKFLKPFPWLMVLSKK